MKDKKLNSILLDIQNEYSNIEEPTEFQKNRMDELKQLATKVTSLENEKERLKKEILENL